MLDFGILGMNARNLQYIKKFNPLKAIRLADNKFRTKRFLWQRWIPVPETYDIIKNRDQLYAYDFSSLPCDDFIVKPVRWSRWRWIYRVKTLENTPEVWYLDKLSMFDVLFTKHSPYVDQWYKISWEYVNDTTYRRFLLDILDGKNSLTSKRDSIMLEETLVPGSWFEAYCDFGLADIRVIVFNLIPVAAMLRVPTKESDGKANLDRWAIGMWVEVGSGKIYAMYKDKKIYTKDFPDPYGSFAHQHLPYWDDILSYSSKIQYFANLGYLALDWVITDEGPKLLEINARAGLKFQNASLLPLRKRLNRIKDVKITSPEKWVEIAQTLFTKHKAQVITDSKILYLRQDGKFDIKTDTDKLRVDVVISIDLKKKRNYLSSNLFAKLQEDSSKTSLLSIEWTGIKFEWLKWKELESSEKNKVVLWTEAVASYYIKPIEKVSLSLDFINPSYIQKTEVDQLHVLDTKLWKIGRILNLSRFLKPANRLEQLDNFVTRWGDYNPTFTYKRPPQEKLNEVGKELEKIAENNFWANGLQSKFAHLFLEKTQELQTKLALIQAYKNQDFDAIQAWNLGLYGWFDPELLQLSKDKIFVHVENTEDLLWRPLRSWELRKRILSYLKEQWLEHVKVSFDQSSVARMTVSKWRHITIKISPTASFKEHELRATLAHEIDVHITRYIHWEQSGWQIMKWWTAGYITDEEWLAVAASRKYLPEGYEAKRLFYRYFFLEQWVEKDFAGLAALVRWLHGYDLARTFNETLRMKKGVQDTSIKHPWTLFMKDKIYLDGYVRVKEWLDAWWDLETLMIGKIKISDLAYIV